MQKVLKSSVEQAHPSEPLRWCRLETPAEDTRRSWKISIRLGKSSGGIGQLSGREDEREDVFPFKKSFASDRFEEDQAHCEEIGPRIEGVPPGLFGAQIAGRALYPELLRTVGRSALFRCFLSV